MDSLLRDLNREHYKMQRDMIALDLHYKNLETYLYQYVKNSVVEWAKLILNHPKASLLIIETTPIYDYNGYANGDNEPIRFTGMSLVGNQKWDLLVKPTHSKQIGGTQHHGLTMKDVAPYLTLAECWHEIAYQLSGQHVVMFSPDWAISALRSVHVADKPYTFLGNAFNLHNKCKEFYNEFYDLSLETILRYQGIDKQRSQLQNSIDRIKVLAQIVENLANDLAKVQEPESTEDDDLEGHPF
jgi:hypothetical protein